MTEKIKCPIHGKELTLERRDNLLVAVCNCEVPNNPYKGKTVHQRPVPAASASVFNKGVGEAQNKKGVTN